MANSFWYKVHAKHGMISTEEQTVVVENQAELTAWFGKNDTQLLNGKYSDWGYPDLDESSLPWSRSLSGDGQYEFLFGQTSGTQSGDSGQRVRLFSDGVYSSNGRYQLFNIDSTDNNAAISINLSKYELEFQGITLPFTIVETENIEIKIIDIQYNTDTRYTVYHPVDYDYIDPDTGTVETIPALAPQNVDTTKYITGVYISVVSKVDNAEYTRLYSVYDLNGMARIGSGTISIFISFAIMNDFCPKYTFNNKYGSTYYSINNTGTCYQNVNGELGFYDNNCKICVPVIKVFNAFGYYGYNEYYNLYMVPLMDTNRNDFYVIDWLKDNLFTNMSNQSQYIPSSDIQLYYQTAGGTDTRLPSGYLLRYTTGRSVTFYEGINLADNFYIPASYDSDSQTFKMTSAITDYNYGPPEPTPEDPDDSGKPNYFTPDINIPEIPEVTDTPPTPEQAQSSTSMDDINGEVNGRSDPGILAQFDDITSNPSDAIDGLNNFNITQINSNIGYDYQCYIGDVNTIAEFRNSIYEIIGAGDKAWMLLSPNFAPEDVITRIIELPYKEMFITSMISSGNITQSAPAMNGIPYTRAGSTISVNDYANIVSGNTGLTTQQVLDYIASFASGTVPLNIRSVVASSPVYYKRLKQRFIEIDYGTQRINRIFGDYNDFTEVNYTAILPTNVECKLDPNLLFRKSDGDIDITYSDVKITGILDIQTGEQLINIYSNDDLVYQTSINVAVERAISGKDEKSPIMAIANSLMTLVKVAASLGGGMGGIVTTNNSGWSRTRSDQGVYDSRGNQQGTISGGKIEQSPSYSQTVSSSAGVLDGVISSGLNLAGNLIGGPRSVQLTQGSLSGSAILVGNLLPYIIIDYPEYIIPRRVRHFGAWDFIYKYEEEYGLPSATFNVGEGFNKYRDVSQIDICWSYSWSYNELAKFKESLIRGFYINNKNNIYVEPSRYYSTVFPSKKVYNQEKYAKAEFEVTNYIVLNHIFSSYQRYVDRYLLGPAAYQSVEQGVMYECFIYDMKNVEEPVIDVSSEIFTHQNEAIWNGRIYRIKTVDYMPGHICRLHLVEDYITSWFYYSIVKGFIEYSSSYFISDIKNELPRTVRRKIKKIAYDSMANYLGYCLIAQCQGQYVDAP